MQYRKEVDIIIKAVIFDMDGVIIDSEPLHYEVNKEIFSELNIVVSEKEYNSYIGTSNHEMWEEIVKKHNLDKKASDLASLQQQKNLEHVINGELELMDNVKELLDDLKNSNINLALGSSSPKKLINKVINNFNIKDYFKIIRSGENVDDGKPAPDLFLKISEELNIKPENIVVIEDSHNGVKAAKNAGMNCIGFSNENSGNQDLSIADLIIDNFSLLSKERLKNFDVKL
ncbi:MAG: HAD family hydrolase [Bacillota bacterium]